MNNSIRLSFVRKPPTPVELKTKVMAAIRQSHRVLSTERNLSPDNENVTFTLTNLVRLLTYCHSTQLNQFLLTTPELAKERAELPVLCGKAECEMEKYWARKLIAQDVPALKDFWYFSEYEALCRAEIGLLRDKKFATIAFLGSGALPLSAILMAKEFPDVPIICVDCDAEACALSRGLIRKLGLAHQISVLCQKASEHEPRENEMTFCASLLEGRQEIYAQFQNQSHSLIVRDSEGAYQYLYKPAELPNRPFQEIAKTPIDPQRINTSRYYVRSKEVLSHVKTS